jgi:hypothetical protein
VQRSRHALPRRLRNAADAFGLANGCRVAYIDRCNNGVWVDVPYEDASQHPYVPNRMGNLT